VAWGMTTAIKIIRKIDGACGFKATIKATNMAKNPRIDSEKSRFVTTDTNFADFSALTGSVANVVKIANEFHRNTTSHYDKELYVSPFKKGAHTKLVQAYK